MIKVSLIITNNKCQIYFCNAILGGDVLNVGLRNVSTFLFYMGTYKIEYIFYMSTFLFCMSTFPFYISTFLFYIRT